MDTYVHPRIWGFDRLDFVETKEQLMHRSRVLAEKGRDGNMNEMLEWYQEQAAKVYDPDRPEMRTQTNRVLLAKREVEPKHIEELPAIDRHHPPRTGK
jgi:hypothetical protein